MARKYRNTLKAQAYVLSSLGAALVDLAHEHRVAANAVEQRPSQGLGDDQFADWIAAAAEISAAAERLLELEVELARHHGVTWERVADAFGVSRQSAWERFRTHSRWDRTHRLSRRPSTDDASRSRVVIAGSPACRLIADTWLRLCGRCPLAHAMIS
jgi:hypothetical protein